MKKLVTGLLVFTAGVGSGVSIQSLMAASEEARPAFLIVSSNRNPGVTAEDYAPYQAAAGPLARAAGLNMVATAQAPKLLEGEWDMGNIAIEQFTSMAALDEFWFSEDYQNAKKLREGLSQINFILAVEGN